MVFLLKCTVMGKGESILNPQGGIVSLQPCLLPCLLIYVHIPHLIRTPLCPVLSLPHSQACLQLFRIILPWFPWRSQ